MGSFKLPRFFRLSLTSVIYLENVFRHLVHVRGIHTTFLLISSINYEYTYTDTTGVEAKFVVIARAEQGGARENTCFFLGGGRRRPLCFTEQHSPAGLYVWC